MNVLVAGAGGLLGRWITQELLRRGVAVRTLVRRHDPARPAATADVRIADALRRDALRGVCDGIDVVVSSLGAAVDPSPLRGWRRFTRVDAPANRALLAEAGRAGVRRFVYVSLNGGAESRQLDYADGHEQVVDALRQSGFSGAVLRPTGFFAAMADLVVFAHRGAVPVFGDGSQSTNPIDERDVAVAAVDEALAAVPGLREVPLGGPEVFSRRRIAELAFAALGKRPRLVHVPSWAARCLGRGLCALNPRAGHFLLFAEHVMTHPCLGPPRGTHRLADAFAAKARALRGGAPA